ncbi:methyl-accepting chemotaxis protein [Alicyclobacillus sp. SO9]|uniref:methyl-accepting chemotaxis protein n=1 Tax=Alicyclobacillus sp. SO9 TaxID=2665646 RepID=UPI0018E7C5A6|nr:methyl-accepting chemotaxis protein [Alicyclobacillus sp. SO9]QQE77939.1 methyl-accepting chemotaxis protein [Alicyclobacillus sp. SO9]
MARLRRILGFFYARGGLSLAQKLIYSFIALNVVLIGLGGIGIINLRMTQQMTHSIVASRLAPLESLTQIQDRLRNIQLDLYQIKLTSSVSQQVNYQSDIQKIETQIDKNLGVLSKTSIASTDQRQWSTFANDLSNSTVAIYNDFSNLRAKSSVKLTSTKSVSQTLSDLNKLIAFETHAANQTVSHAHNVYVRALFISLIVIAAALLLSVLLAIFTLRATLRPVRMITSEMKRIAQNSGDLTKRLQIRSRDEFGQLADSFNEMIGSIQNIVRTISDSTDQMAATSQELVATSGEVTSISVQIAERTQGISSGAASQQKATQDAMNMVTSMNEHIQTLRRNAEQVSTSSAGSKSTVERGHKAIKETSTQITTAANSINTLSEQVDSLGGQVEQINSIVNLISGIADQSNLLALNASVEAARAGENGRSFAVVANEMRKMSQNSKDAALQIQKIAQHIQAEMSSVLTQMHNSKKTMDTGLETMDTSAVSFNEIAIHVDGVHHQIEEALSEITELAASATNVNKSVAEVLTIAEGFSRSTEEVAAATEEQSATMEEAAAGIEHITQHAESLTVLIGEFTY